MDLLVYRTALARSAKAKRKLNVAKISLRKMKVSPIIPITLEGRQVVLEPLSMSHEAALIEAASDGKLWKSRVTNVPDASRMRSYIDAALAGVAERRELPFVIIRKSSGKVVGSTRFYNILPADRSAEIGYTWLAASAQRTAVNTEAKLLLLTHAFETMKCIRVTLITDVLNEQSRAAILRLGAKQEGVMRSHIIMPDGRVRDSVLFSIIEGEWPEVKTRLEEKLSNLSQS